MAAYAALVSLMQIIHQIKNHPFPPISVDKQQVESLTQNITSLQNFLEGYSSPFSDRDEADPMEIRIAKAAYAAEDVIESCIVEAINLSRSTATDDQEPDDSGSSSEGDDSGEGSESSSSEEVEDMYIINLFQETADPGEGTKSGSREGDGSGEQMASGSSEGTTSSSDEGDGFGEETASGSREGTTSNSREGDDSGEGTTSGSNEGTTSSDGDGTTSSSSDEASCISNLYQDLHRAIEGMHLIKKEVEENINTEKVVPHASIASSRSPSTGQDNTMVGSEEALPEIMDPLTRGPPDCHIIPIVGMGGIGKTTLAKTVYSKQLIVERFHIRLWATISQQHNIREILCELVSQATGEKKEQMSGRSVGELGLELYQFLFGRRYLVVMDDMWGVGAWDSIRKFFPDTRNHSRILVTTRLMELSSKLNNSYSLQMKFLDEDSSWKLFSRIVFGKESCPPKLEGIGKKIIESCKGLPLSIVVVGGLLRKMEDIPECWESIWEDLTSRVNLENDKHCLKLLKVSYIHLPVYLKPCFLYMGVFDEDDEIDVAALIKLWISEGFLKPINGESLETTARGFLKDLVDRNLVLTEKSWFGCTGNMKYCKMHDLLRDLCLKEGKENGFFHIVGEDNPQSINSQRRIVIPESASKEEISDALQSLSCIRSVISDDDDDDKVQDCRKSRLLRTLNARNQVNGSDKKPFVFRFVNLRHVIVEAHSKLSINHLWNLQTLIVYTYAKFKAPVGMWKMPQLRHIEFMEHKMSLPDPPPSGDDDVVVMENLHTFKGVGNFKCNKEVVKRIPNIKRLLIEYCKVKERRETNDDYYYLSNIESLSKLESFTCGEPLKEGTRTTPMQKLTFPRSIKKLTLTMSYNEEMLVKIGSLPLLQKLKMLRGSFKTGKWEVGENQFLSLKSLTLLGCQNLKQWTTEESSSSIFPHLEQFRLSGLTQLEGIPSEIGDILTLEKVDLHNCSESAVKCAKAIIVEQEEMQGEVGFRVSVVVRKRFEALKSLASPNFDVEVSEFV